MVNVTIYSIHGSYGYSDVTTLLLFRCMQGFATVKPTTLARVPEIRNLGMPEIRNGRTPIIYPLFNMAMECGPSIDNIIYSNIYIYIYII